MRTDAESHQRSRCQRWPMWTKAFPIEVPLRAPAQPASSAHRGGGRGCRDRILSCLGHQQGEEQQRKDSDPGKEQEAGGVTEPLYNVAGNGIAEGSADADRERGQSLSKVETARTAHQVGSHKNGDDTEDAS